MSEATWTALTIVLTVLGAAWTVYAFRNRGVASGLRGAGITLLPMAALLTDSLETLTTIGTEVVDWARGLVFSPSVWIGVGLAGLAVVLFVVSGMLRNSGRGTTPLSGATAQKQRSAPTASTGGRAAPAGRPAEVGPARGGQQGGQQGDLGLGDDLGDIEAILKRRGIS